MEKTTQDILNEAAELLDQEGRWTKGAFFKAKPGSKGCAMCAHGAIAYCGNRAIRELIEENNLTEACSKTSNGISGYGGDVAAQQHNLRQAHFNANKVGLNYGFNDSPKTTKEDVINKLHEAAQL